MQIRYYFAGKSLSRLRWWIIHSCGAFTCRTEFLLSLMIMPITVLTSRSIGAFALLLLLSAYMGLLPHSTSSSIPTQLQPNDKFLHLVTFFFLTLLFYWIPDTSRRRTLQITLLVCTLLLGVGSEIVQGLLPNGRSFDPFDILANVVGSLGAVGLCSWYHRRMLERRRKARFGALADDEDPDDIELGLGTADGEADGTNHLGPQETGVTTLEQEVDNWDENAVDNWDTDDGPGPEVVSNHLKSDDVQKGSSGSSTEANNNVKTRYD
jgi:VanZ family protein